MCPTAPEDDAAAAVAEWAASGAMALTGWPDEAPLGPPARLVPRARELDAALAGHAARLGRTLALATLPLLAERAALEGLRRAGRTSCGGATRLLPAGDGWVAVALARPDDLDLLPAWLGVDPPPPGGDPWPVVAGAVGRRSRTEVVDGARLLGLPVAALPDPLLEPHGGSAVTRTPIAGPPAPAVADLEGLLVVDLGALWAGPLCASVLLHLGADVVKVESTQRPDGARRGGPHFHLLQAGKRSVALDLTTAAGRRALLDLVAAADVVVEASRPRALRGLGVVAEDLLAGARPRAWVSITGYGRAVEEPQPVAFGDDAAVAGGLVAWDGRGEPVFCADAVADPLTGLTAAVAVLDALAEGGRWLLDVAMAGVAASAAGPTLPVPAGVEAAPPRARPPIGQAAPLGADTEAVLEAVARRPGARGRCRA